MHCHGQERPSALHRVFVPLRLRNINLRADTGFDRQDGQSVFGRIKTPYGRQELPGSRSAGHRNGFKLYWRWKSRVKKPGRKIDFMG